MSSPSPWRVATRSSTVPGPYRSQASSWMPYETEVPANALVAAIAATKIAAKTVHSRSINAFVPVQAASKPLWVCIECAAVAISRLIVANRGEIAARIFRTCERLRIESVAVAAGDDRSAYHTRCAGQTIEFGSYLDASE